jgi:hypothetical protein
LTKSYPRIRYIVGHGDVRDTNHGEPYGVSFEQLLAELAAEQHIALKHPATDEQPLLSFRIAAQRLLQHPLTPRSAVPVPQIPTIETATCSDGAKVTYLVPSDVLQTALGH